MSTALIVVEDGEVPGRNREEKEKVLKEWHQFNLDHYYELIQEHTFATKFVKFTQTEAQAFLKVARLASLDETDSKHIARLKKRLAKAIREVQQESSEEKVFMRLSTRSPKDAVDKRPDLVIPLLASHLSALAKQRGATAAKLSANDQLICIRRAFRDVMGVKSVDEAIDLFSYSARIISDIKRAIDLGQWDIHVVVRSFSPVPIEGELRGFVHDGKLRALSQYYSECYFAELNSDKASVAKKARAFHRQLREKLPFSSYIFDVVAYGDGTIKVVELNPFGPHTGAALFSWTKDESILKSGPFEFRVREESIEDKLIEAIIFPWKGILSSAIKSPQ